MTSIHEIEVRQEEMTPGAVAAANRGFGAVVGAAAQRDAVMPAQHYRPFDPFGRVPLRNRCWPNQVIESPPRWCSVDLRDGNQALIEPMGLERKFRMYDGLVRMGFKEIEVGFPSASQAELEFVRALIEEDRIPGDVTIQVLTQAREELIRPTVESIRGARRAIVHLYNSTSTLQRRVVFRRGRQGIIDIATDAARLIRELAEQLPDTEIVYQYSPESFTGTELDFAIEICEAVMNVYQPTAEAPMILNLPATVEMSAPNVYADQVEYFSQSIRDREKVILSVHPHNDRGTAVAAAELAMMAGAERVEGTLFGNGERTGNVDIVTLALNMFSQGIDPQLDLSDVNALVRLVEYCNRIPVHPRHPYAGDLVFTAFSGSHQDAIKKGLEALRSEQGEQWEVPYLPIDPAHVGRGYDELIRVNSQSGKGGVAFLLERDHGICMPRRMQIEFQRHVQRVAEETGEEISSKSIAEIFRQEYVERRSPLALVEDESRIVSLCERQCEIRAVVEWAGGAHTLSGEGNGPIDAFYGAIDREFALGLRLCDYREHALGQGADAMAITYVEVMTRDGRAFHGAGLHASIVWSSLHAVVSAVNRAAAAGRVMAREAAPSAGPGGRA